MSENTAHSSYICGHECITALWTYGRNLRRGQVPFLVHIKVGAGPSVAMENESAVYTRNTLTSRNHMQKAAMFALTPKTHLGSTD